MKKQALGLSILLLAPGFVAASSKPTPPVSSSSVLLANDRAARSGLVRAEGELLLAQQAVIHYKKQLAETSAAIRSDISAKTQELAKLKAERSQADAAAAAKLQEQIKQLTAEISNARAQIGEKESAKSPSKSQRDDDFDIEVNL